MAAGKKFVVDSSFLLCFLLPDERDELVDEVLDKYTNGKVELFAPLLLPFEIFNGLKVAISRKRISYDEAISLGQRFLRLSIPLIEIDYAKTQEKAHEKDLTFYDAAYLYLSKTEGIPLLALDQKLKDLS